VLLLEEAFVPFVLLLLLALLSLLAEVETSIANRMTKPPMRFIVLMLQIMLDVQ